METSICSHPSPKCITTTENLSIVLEQFVRYHSCYQWDKAKEFIEHERDLFRSTFPTRAPSILVQLFTNLIQLANADKSYMLLQLFSTKVFQRKDTVKSAYENVKREFQQLAQLGQISLISASSYSETHESPWRSEDSNDDERTLKSSTEASTTESESAIDVLNCDMTQMYQSRRMLHSPGDDGDQHSIGSASSTLSGSTPTSPKGTPQNRGILSKFLRSFSKPNYSPELVSASSFEQCSRSSSRCSRYVSVEPLAINFESVERLAAHVASQLACYAMARLRMLEIYERLALMPASKNKFYVVEDLLKEMYDIKQHADGFHHPALTVLSSMFYYEYHLLFNLLRCHHAIQGWRYMEALCCLQESSNLLNSLINLKDRLLFAINSNNMNIPTLSIFLRTQTHLQPPLPLPFQSPAPQPSAVAVATATTSAGLPRNATSSSLASSASSTAATSAPSLTPNSSIVSFSFPSSPSPTVPPPMVTPTTPSSMFSKVLFRSSGAAGSNPGSSSPVASMPHVFKWLHQYRMLLLAKFSLYFHSLLVLNAAMLCSSKTGKPNGFTNLPSTVYWDGESQVKSLISRQLLAYDFPNKATQLVKKCDGHVLLVFETREAIEMSFIGYRSPYIKGEVLKGVNSYPIVYSNPPDFPKSRLPSLIMVMTRRMKDLNSLDSVVIEHDRLEGSADMPEKKNSMGQPNTTYFLTRPDPDMTLVVASDATRKVEKEMQFIVAQLHELSTVLRGTKVFESLKKGGVS